jgi:predicted helicase
MSNNTNAQILHFDLFGKREHKYDFLTENSLQTIAWTALQPTLPELFFVQKNFAAQAEYKNGFALQELFTLNNVGIVTAKDAILINEKEEVLLKNVNQHYSILANQNLIKKLAYRPFDSRFVYYDVSLIERAREKIMQHFIKGENLGISICKQFKTGVEYQHVFISNKIVESCFVSNRTSEITSVFPLYLYPETTAQQSIEQANTRTPNLNIEIVNKIATKLGLMFTTEKETTKGSFAPIDILDYIYAVLHSPTYREKYKEFLKIDFPRVPYPKDTATFWALVALGTQIRQIHLLESPVVTQYITQYPIDGHNKVTKPKYVVENSVGKVFINDTQYFNNVPEVAWHFFIGGYQPAQKWLKDRKERTLDFEDILHYQKIIVALTETDRLMKEVDKIAIE